MSSSKAEVIAADHESVGVVGETVKGSNSPFQHFAERASNNENPLPNTLISVVFWYTTDDFVNRHFLIFGADLRKVLELDQL